MEGRGKGSFTASCDEQMVQPGVSFLTRMAVKMIGVMSRRFDRTQSESDVESNITSSKASHPNTLQNHSVFQTTNTYQQSSTRRLAFGSGVDVEVEKKPVDDFYNNSTLTNLSKLFCAVVLVTAFFLVMSRSFDFQFPHLV